MSLYEICVLGNVTNKDFETIIATLKGNVEAFNLKLGDGVAVRRGKEVSKRDRHAATVVAYFGGRTHSDIEYAREAVNASLPIIPCISASGDFGREIPDFLQCTNGFRRRVNDAKLDELAAVLLECLGLLRRQRRVFVSYRRIESRSAAVQLHDLLSARGFDVFLDTHDIRPGETFQELLWHRLCDSDVMVMLDTPTYFESKWTRHELARARAKEIHVLRVIWPGHSSKSLLDFAESVHLEHDQLNGSDGPIADEVADKIALATENLRSRSIAARHMSITGKLRAEVERIGGKILGVGAHRAIAVQLADGKQLWAYPVVGIPTADLLNDISNKAKRADQREKPILVYDHIGIREEWLAHLKWLDEHINVVSAVPVAEAAWRLAVWEEER